MTSKVIQTATGNQIEYKVIKDGYKTVSQTIDVTDSLPTRGVYNLSPSTTVHNPELDYTVDTSHKYPPVITFNKNVVTPDDTEITTNKYVLAPYGQDYLIMDNQQEDNFTKVGNVEVSKDGIVSGFSNSNYLTFSTQSTTLTSFEIQMKVKFSSNDQASGRLLNSIGGSDTVNGFFIRRENNVSLVFYTGSQYYNFCALNIAENDKDYLLKWVWDGNTVKSYYSESDEDHFILNSEVEHTSFPVAAWSYSIGVRTISPNYTLFNGNIDLSKTYIKYNGEFAWQPTWNKLSNNYRVGGGVYVDNNIASNLTTWLAPAFTPTTDTWEFTTKIYTGSELTSHHNQILHNSTQGYAMAVTRKGRTGTPMSSHINSSWKNGTTSLSANTWYWFRFSCANRVCKLYITEFDNQSECPSASSMTLQCTVTANVSFIGNTIMLSTDGSEYWGGQIDLKQTQFIEGDRVWKYKDTYFNNASAYTIGTPNFYEGKMWGFSTSCYLSLPRNWSSTNNWEFVTKFKINSFNTATIIWHAELFANLEISANTGSVNEYNFQNGQSYEIFTAELDKWYWVKCIVNGTTKTYFVSEDGINYQQKISQTDTSISPSSNYEFRIGLSSYDSSRPFTNGIIDLTGGYLKINDELIWKGSEKVADFLPGILDSSYSDTGDQVTLNLYDVETNDRNLILNNNRNVTVIGKQFVQYNGQVTIPAHKIWDYTSGGIWTQRTNSGSEIPILEGEDAEQSNGL